MMALLRSCWELITDFGYPLVRWVFRGKRASINHIYETTDDSPHTNTVHGHFPDQLDCDNVESVGNTLLQRDVLELLPDRWVKVVDDLYLDPYYGDEDKTESLYFSKAKVGTTAFHACVALYVRVRNKCNTGWKPAGPPAGPRAFLVLFDGFDTQVKVAASIAASTTAPA